MNIFQIQYVFAVAKNSSFTKAAQELHISQPALSSNIQKLEEELGTELFNRSSFPVQLTYAGEVFLKKGIEILSLSDKLEKEIRDITIFKKGQLKLGVGQGMMPYVLPKVINAFHSTYPNIQIKGSILTEFEMIDGILNNSIDFGIYSEYEPLPSTLQSELDYEDLGKEELLLAAHKTFIQNHHLVQGLTNTLDIRTLSDIPLVMPPENTFLRRLYNHILNQYEVIPNTVSTVDDSISLYRLADTGFAAGIVPKITTKWVQSSDETQLYSLSANSIFLKLKIIYHKRTHIGEPEEYLIALLRKIIAEA